MSADAEKIRRARAVRELRRILPKETPAPFDREPLAELLTRVSGKRMPATSFARAWILGSLQAKLAAGYFAFWLRGKFADADIKARLKSEAQLAAALELFGTMGYLRGAVMKIGQLLANLPAVVPEEVAEVLAALHFEAPSMHYSIVRELFLDEFGCEPEEMFASFDRQAFSAASLGQVHLARLPSGENVAVKIQYPDIARTIRADLRNLRILLQPMRLSGDWQPMLDTLADVERMLLMETDYDQEARSCREARSLFTPDDGIVVPKVYDAYSGKRVLTTEYLPGRHLREYLATNPGQEERDRFTRLLVLATMRPFYRTHRLFADPHPGNFLFMDDGRLGILDFGCVRTLSDEEWRLLLELDQAVRTEDEPCVDRCIARACLFDDPAEMEPDRLATLRRSMEWNFEPWRTEGPFDFGDEGFYRRGIDVLAAVARKRYTRAAPLHLWLSRFIFGSRAMAYRLKGRCDFRQLYRQEFPDPASP
ncbi:MAG: AarF/ABC1/UbiB kinase family protein [bacterium]|jgi:predicted unusual protein kinase regulating ubiquinone biosynthesis (AarF/ABC1/UbiB family)